MKKKKYLPLYYKWAKSGEISSNGLCNCFGEKDALFDLLKPESHQYMYWGNDGVAAFQVTSDRDWTRGFNALRQNIVLLLAAMNNELYEEPRSGGMKKGKKESA